MAAVSRIYTFTDGNDAYGSQVESEFGVIYNAWNNHDAGTSIWTSLKAALLTMSGNVVMATNKITGLGNGTAAQDAVALTQLKVLQIVNATATTATSTTSTSFTNTNLTASITPSSASNKILVLVSGNLNLASTTVNLTAFATLFGAGADLGAAGDKGLQSVVNIVSSATSRLTYPINMNFLHSPATTSPTTYVVEIRVDSAGLTAAWGQGGDGTNLTTTITLLEVVA